MMGRFWVDFFVISFISLNKFSYNNVILLVFLQVLYCWFY